MHAAKVGVQLARVDLFPQHTAPLPLRSRMLQLLLDATLATPAPARRRASLLQALTFCPSAYASTFLLYLGDAQAPRCQESWSFFVTQLAGPVRFAVLIRALRAAPFFPAFL